MDSGALFTTFLAFLDGSSNLSDAFNAFMGEVDGL